ncbi:hypothetical protein ES702_03576 [subsurface metagenome]
MEVSSRKVPKEILSYMYAPHTPTSQIPGSILMGNGLGLARNYVRRLWSGRILLWKKANISYIRGRSLCRQQFHAMGG